MDIQHKLNLNDNSQKTLGNFNGCRTKFNKKKTKII